MGLIKLSAWAAKHGWSRQNAYKNARRHSIPLIELEGKPLQVDEEEADRIWSASLNPAKQRGGAAGGDAIREPSLFDEPEIGSQAAGPQSALGKAQLAQVLLNIRHKRLTVDQMEGKVVSLAGVREFEAAQIAQCKAQLLQIGPELRDDLAHEDDPVRCETMVTARITKALASIASWRPTVE